MCPLGHLVAEFLSTGSAGVGQHSCVDPTMYQVRNPLSETLAASLTDEGSLPTVNPLVVLQGGEFLECSATILSTATVRVLVCVVPHVFVVGLLEGKRLSTEVA